ncbi:MAG: hypothetical protein KKH54_10820 [Alphaproteobacteria bacterium]|nr:hypothetical protein [Alphaproteobacteria bacterium]
MVKNGRIAARFMGECDIFTLLPAALLLRLAHALPNTLTSALPVGGRAVVLALLLLRGLLLRRRVGSRRIADMRGAFDLHLADAHGRQSRVQAQPVAVLSQGGFGDVA